MQFAPVASPYIPQKTSLDGVNTKQRPIIQVVKKLRQVGLPRKNKRMTGISDFHFLSFRVGGLA